MIHPLPHSSKRFALALLGSAGANLLVWYSLSQLSGRIPPYRPPAVLTFSRVTIDKKGVKVEKIIKPKEIKKRVEEVKPKEPEPKKIIEPVRQPQKPPPEGAHNRVITQKSPVATPDAHPFTALPDGNAPLAQPVTQQTGNGTTNTSTPPPAKTPDVPPATTPPVKPDLPPATVPPPVVKHEEPPVQPPPPPPKPKGPTQDAQPIHTEDVEIPDTLKDQTFKTHVHVKVIVSADGSFDVVLRTTSGNPDIDKLVLDCLKKWKWKPALKDGEPVDSSHLFNFEFEVK